MKNNRLKEFIDSNRKDFDEIESPALNFVWNEISSDKKTKPSKSNYLLVIVALLFAVVAVLIVSNRQTSQKLDRLENYVLNSPQYKNEHHKLIKTVSDKEDQIQTQNIKEEDFKEIFEELNELERNHSFIQEDFQKYGNTDELMRTLFKHYERKSKILEILLLENEKRKYNEHINHREI